MYDELLGKIRQLLEYKGLMPVQVIMVYKELLGKAADAIEELVGFVQEAERDRDEYRERLDKANDVIEELSAKVYSLQFFADNISKLPDCNTCLKKGMCEFMPRYGDYCRINCPAWLGAPEPPKEE